MVLLRSFYQFRVIEVEWWRSSLGYGKWEWGGGEELRNRGAKRPRPSMDCLSVRPVAVSMLQQWFLLSFPIKELSLKLMKSHGCFSLESWDSIAYTGESLLRNLHGGNVIVMLQLHGKEKRTLLLSTTIVTCSEDFIDQNTALNYSDLILKVDFRCPKQTWNE